MLTFIEQAEKAFDAEQAEQAAEKLMGGSFTLHDFLQQMEAMAKMGSMSKIMGMLPGMGQFKEQLENFDEREVDRIKAIILSMTPSERDDPKMIDGSRRARIARGSGTEVRDVNQLVDRFFEARKMMQQMGKGGGMPGMPGMPGMGGMPGLPGGGKRAGARQKPQKKKGKRGSGNPAKRAAEEKAAAARGSAGGAGAFGLPSTGSGQATDDDGEFELPKELRDLM
jgi:signal recognition particle subunit SRP54